MADWRRETREAAERYGLDPDIFERQIRQESGFDTDIRSPAGALGIAQIMPATARGWGVDPLNPRQALDAAARNMAKYVRQYGGYENALRAYNAGPGAIQKSRQYDETNNYVRTILGGHDPGNLASPAPSSGSPRPAGGTAAPAPAPAPSAPTIGSGQAGDFTSLLATLQGQQQPEPQQAPAAIPIPQGLDPRQMPQGFRPVAPTQQKAPEQEQGVSQALGLLEALRGGGLGVEASGASEGAERPPADPFANVTQQRQQGVTSNNYRQFKTRADLIDAAGLPYQWGGGHQRKVDVNKDLVPLDCSGAVSAVLGIDPRTSGAFATWGRAGDGGDRGITVYANDEHVFMKIDGKFFGTSSTNPGGGAGWIPRGAISREYLKGFTARHM